MLDSWRKKNHQISPITKVRIKAPKTDIKINFFLEPSAAGFKCGADRGGWGRGGKAGGGVVGRGDRGLDSGGNGGRVWTDGGMGRGGVGVTTLGKGGLAGGSGGRGGGVSGLAVDGTG